MSGPDDPRIPPSSIVFSLGPILTLVAAAFGAWLLQYPWPGIATPLAIGWSAIILVFVTGIRRGLGFGRPSASTSAEIAAMLADFIPAGLALVVPDAGAAL